MSITLDEFLALLPQAPPRPLDRDYMAKHGVSTGSENPKFVPPKLSLIEGHDRPSIVLVEAPGAVGKTTLADFIAMRIGCPCWDLGRSQVGNAFVWGAIGQLFSAASFSAVFEELRHGERLIIFDGLDEASLAARSRNFEAFLEDVSAFFIDPRDHPALLMFGRTQAVEDALIVLKAPYAHYEIEYFDHDRACRFVEIAAPEAMDNTKELARARELLFNTLIQALGRAPDPTAWSDPVVRSVLGYAPVLQFIGEALNDRNPYRVAEAIARGRGKTPEEYLLDVARYVLRREHDKAVAGLTKRLGAHAATMGWSAWETLYREEEQCLRLLGEQLKTAPAEMLPRELVGPLRDEYEEAVREHLPNHPFSRHPVLMEYAYAWQLVMPTADPTLGDALFAWLRSHEPRYRPSPLLAKVALALGRAAANPAVDARNFGFLYESFLAGLRKDEALRLTVAWPPAGDARVYLSSLDRGGTRIEIELRRPDDGLWFWRRLERTLIDGPFQVVLGSPDSDFVLGPDVTLECDSLTCESRTVYVRSADKQEDKTEKGEEEGKNAVTLVARTYVARGPAPELRGERSGLRASWEPLQPPWSAYRIATPPKTRVSPEMTEAFKDLKALVLWFRAEGYEEMELNRRHVETVVIGTRTGRRAMLKFCLHKGVVADVGPRYRLERRAVNQWGLNVVHLNTFTYTDPIVAFLSEYLRWLRAATSPS